MTTYGDDGDCGREAAAAGHLCVLWSKEEERLHRASSNLPLTGSWTLGQFLFFEGLLGASKSEVIEEFYKKRMLVNFLEMRN